MRRLILIAGLLMTTPVHAGQDRAEPVETGSGRYPAMYETEATLPNHVAYRPKDMTALGKAKLGIYVFGNGACSADGTSSRNHLLQIASHGYVAIAPGMIPDPKAKPAPPAARSPEGKLAAPTKASALREAIDWAVRENRRQGSPLFGRIATDQIAVSGFSCGGLQAIQVASDPRVRTTIVMNSGVFNGPSRIAGMDVPKSAVTDLRHPLLYVLGGPTDIAYENGMDDYRRITAVPAAMVNIPVGHGGTYMQPHGGVAAEVVTAWLDWQLKGDAAAGRAFTGEPCGLCGDKRLTIERKNIR